MISAQSKYMFSISEERVYSMLQVFLAAIDVAHNECMHCVGYFYMYIDIVLYLFANFIMTLNICIWKIVSK